jgi:hypothetical protein
MNEQADKYIVAKILTDMWKGGYFDICAVDKCMKLLELPAWTTEQFRKYHCVSWNVMPKGFPEKLMSEVLSAMTQISMDSMIKRALDEVAEERKAMVLTTLEGMVGK